MASAVTSGFPSTATTGTYQVTFGRPTALRPSAIKLQSTELVAQRAVLSVKIRVRGRTSGAGATVPTPTPTPVGAVAPAPAPAPAGGVSGVYGPGITMDTLWNTQVGGPDRLAVSYVFRATSSQIKSARFYMIPTGYSGYGAGTGGTIRVTIEADQNGSPSGTALASDNVPGTIDTNAVATFASAAAVTPGRLYHVVFRNVDANPTQNYASVDAAAWFGASTSQQRNPGWPNEEMRVLMSQNGGGWQERPGHTPILNLTYADGSQSGQGYMEVEVGHPAVISGTSSLVRERFTPGTARFVSEVGVRVARTSGSGGLVMSILDTAGSTLRSVTVNASSVPVLPSVDASAGVWLNGSFSTLTLAAGTTYDLVLSTTGGVVLWTRGIQQGDGYSYAPATYFGDGSLAVSSNGGSSWSTVSGLGASGDLQFYFR